jgi:hypothetical protein
VARQSILVEQDAIPDVELLGQPAGPRHSGQPSLGPDAVVDLCAIVVQHHAVLLGDSKLLLAIADDQQWIAKPSDPLIPRRKGVGISDDQDNVVVRKRIDRTVRNGARAGQ